MTPELGDDTQVVVRLHANGTHLDLAVADAADDELGSGATALAVHAVDETLVELYSVEQEFAKLASPRLTTAGRRGALCAEVRGPRSLSVVQPAASCMQAAPTTNHHQT